MYLPKRVFVAVVGNKEFVLANKPEGLGLLRFPNKLPPVVLVLLPNKPPPEATFEIKGFLRFDSPVLVSL